MQEEQSNELCSIPWKKGQKLICNLRTYRGNTALDIRIHFFDFQLEEWQPTKAGIWVPLEKTREFKSCIEEAIAKLQQWGVQKERVRPEEQHEGIEEDELPIERMNAWLNNEENLR